MTTPDSPLPRKQQLRVLRVLRARRRLAGSLAAGIVTFLLLPATLAPSTRLLIAWDVTCALFLVLAYIMMWRTDASHVKRNAPVQDVGRFSILILTALAAFASLAAIVAELSAAHGAPQLLIFVTATIALSWVMIHTVFALHYAHEYYYEGGTKGGMTFPGDDRPDYWDFVYFAFVIGMTAQVSDVAITDKTVRRTATAHGIASFTFNTALLALMVNIAASAL
jgi:uncharacterized membrane protein